MKVNQQQTKKRKTYLLGLSLCVLPYMFWVRSSNTFCICRWVYTPANRAATSAKQVYIMAKQETAQSKRMRPAHQIQCNPGIHHQVCPAAKLLALQQSQTMVSRQCVSKGKGGQRKRCHTAASMMRLTVNLATIAVCFSVFFEECGFAFLHLLFRAPHWLNTALAIPHVRVCPFIYFQ